MDTLTLLKGIVAPVLIALALVGVAGNRLLPLAIALGVGAAFVLAEGWPALPHELWQAPHEVGWTLWGVVGLALAASLGHWLLPRRWGPWAVALAAAVAAWLVLARQAAGAGTGWAVLHVGGGGLTLALLTLGGARLVARAPRSPFLPVLVGGVFAGDAVVLVLGHCQLPGLLATACAAAVAAAIATAFWRRPFTMTPADGALFGALHGLFLLAAVHRDDLGWPAALLAAVAPALPLALPKSFAGERPKRWMLVAALLAALPFVAVVLLGG